MQRKQYLQELLSSWVKQLVALKNALKKDLFQLKMQHATTGIKETSGIKNIRRNIARVNTVLSHKITTLYGSSMK